jgi:hypothetical protein
MPSPCLTTRAKLVAARVTACLYLFLSAPLFFAPSDGVDYVDYSPDNPYTETEQDQSAYELSKWTGRVAEARLIHASGVIWILGKCSNGEK